MYYSIHVYLLNSLCVFHFTLFLAYYCAKFYNFKAELKFWLDCVRHHRHAYPRAHAIFYTEISDMNIVT